MIFLKAAQRRESNIAKTKMDFYVIYELFKDEPELMDYVFILHKRKSTYFKDDFHGTSSPF